MEDGKLSDRELVRIELHAMFRFNRFGRISAVNDTPEIPGPRIFRTSAGGESLLRIRHDVPESIARKWLAASNEEQLRTEVQRHHPVVSEYRGPAFVLPQILSETEAVPVGPSTPLHPQLIARGWKAAETAPYVGVVRNGLVVAVCYSSRLSERAAAAGVETTEEHRGQGLALEAVKAWAATVQASGRIAFYSTESTNSASRRVAEKLGAREFGEHWHLT